ncbi:hypothetical protein [Lysobacter sp. CA199]|uniref:hypothetical protein n=1 Tax=Lysobacter sp. CA199 TaxID=3455608 RepID=UPI003F8D2B23
MSQGGPLRWLYDGAMLIWVVAWSLGACAMPFLVLGALVMRSCRDNAPAYLQAGRIYWTVVPNAKWEMCGAHDTWAYLKAGGWNDFAVLVAAFVLLVMIAVAIQVIRMPSRESQSRH